ncbi:DUF2341 domain-containing protein, partial [Candidatus Micrarchaeota archaeon]|nr:DUF2341 domain-containing protein [Candidatus Micrarchaeota archaeon]
MLLRVINILFVFNVFKKWSRIIIKTNTGKIILILLLLISISFAWWNVSWSDRITLIVNSSLIDEELTDFPILVKLDTNRVDYPLVKPNGEDIRFVNEYDNLTFSHEIELWNSSGDSFIWVKIPEVSNTTNTSFYMYYGNSEAEDTQNATNVWSNEYLAVWHLSETGSSTREDSTSTSNDLTRYGGTTGTPSVIDGGNIFDGVNDYLKSTKTITYSSDFTLEMFIKGDPSENSDKRLFFQYDPATRDGVQVRIAPMLSFRYLENNAQSISFGENITNEWQYFVGRRIENRAYLRVNLTDYSPGDEVVGSVSSTDNIYIGQDRDNGKRFSGSVDEIRISNVARSNAWITASYYSEIDELLIHIKPYLGDINLTPLEPTTDEDLIVNATCHSTIPASTLTVFVQMYKNGVLYGENQSQEVVSGENTIVYTLNSGNTTPGESWLAEVWCSNGNYTTQKQNTTSRTIDNTPPTLDYYNITPVLPSTEDDLLINVTCSDVDIGGTLTAYVQMYVDNTVFGSIRSLAVISGENTLVYALDNSETSSGENWSAEVWCSDGYLNSSKENTSEVLVVGYAKINIISPLDGDEIVRGKNDAGEDSKSYVSNTQTIIAKVFDVNNISKPVLANCSFYVNDAYQGDNSTNESGYCVYIFDKTVFDAGKFELKVTAENFTNSYTTQGSDNESIINTTLIKYITTLTPENYRTPGPYYLVGDAAVLKIDITKDGSQEDVTEIEVSLYASNDDINPVSTVAYPSRNLFRVSEGIYRSVNVIPLDFNPSNDVKWVVKVNDEISGVRQPASSASHADREVEPTTATLIVNSIDGTGSNLTNYSFQLYDAAGYALENRSLTGGLSRGVGENSNYSLSVQIPDSETIILRNINISNSEIQIIPQFVENYTGDLPSNVDNVSSIIALNGTNISFENATLIFEKQDLNINYIFKCSDWSFATGNCSGTWDSNPVSYYPSFGENETHFWFTVTEFSGYGGGDGGSTINEVSLIPDLDISRFLPYNITANITNTTELSSVTVNVSAINGEGIACWDYYINGTCGSEELSSPMVDQGEGIWLKENIYLDHIYPEIYFSESDITWYNEPDENRMWRGNYHLFNFTNSFDMENNMSFWIEFNSIAAAGNSVDLSVYIIGNGSDQIGLDYFTEDWRSKDNTELVATLDRNIAFHHTHTVNSTHHLVALGTNADGTIGSKNINVSEYFWVILYPDSPNT